jgi:hypothetical protein
MQWIAEEFMSYKHTDEQDYNCISMSMITHHHALKSRTHSVTSVPSVYCCGMVLGHRDTLPSFERMVINVFGMQESCG